MTLREMARNLEDQYDKLGVARLDMVRIFISLADEEEENIFKIKYSIFQAACKTVIAIGEVENQLENVMEELFAAVRGEKQLL